jgi:hypothetical protein
MTKPRPMRRGLAVVAATQRPPLIHCNLQLRRNQIAVRDLVVRHHFGTSWNVSVTDDSAGSHQPYSQSPDQKTCRSICDAIGARLQRDLSPWALVPSARLDRLIEEMRRREAADHSH